MFHKVCVCVCACAVNAMNLCRTVLLRGVQTPEVPRGGYDDEMESEI